MCGVGSQPRGKKLKTHKKWLCTKGRQEEPWRGAPAPQGKKPKKEIKSGCTNTGGYYRWSRANTEERSRKDKERKKRKAE